MMMIRGVATGTPRGAVRASKPDCLIWDPVRGLHQGQRSYAPRQQAGHMTATYNDQHQSKFTLAETEPSTHDSTSFDSAN